jgi:hypothetical protein
MIEKWGKLCFCRCIKDKDQNNNHSGYYLSLLCNKHQRRPRELVLSKKKKAADGTQAVKNAKRGNVTRYYNFIAKTVDILYQQG